MRRLTYAVVFLAAMMIMACGGNRATGGNELADDTLFTDNEKDSAIYGVVGEGTTMHMLEIVTESGKTISLEYDADSVSDIQGGIFSGDRVTLTMKSGEAEPHIVKLVNLTSLLGKWVSLDRNFEIKEDGTIVTSQKAESQPWTHWEMHNAQLVLNADTFDVIQLGSDSLSLENATGIFVYKRLAAQKK